MLLNKVNYNRSLYARELKINDLTTVGRASLILALMIGLSRLTGLGRTVVAAHFFGRSAQTDVFGAAFNIPDTLTILISGGLLATGFVPVFTRYLSQNQTERARITFRALLTLMLVGFGGLSMGLFALTFTPLATLLYPKNIGPEFTDLYLTSLRILLVAQWIFVVGGVFSGTFNALRLFWFPALQPVFYNVGTIVGGVWGAPHAGSAGNIEYQAWGALGGAFVGTFVMLAPAARHHGLSLRPLWDLTDEGVRRVAASLLPIFLGLASGQIIALNLPRALASWLDEGALSSLDYANRLMQVPLDLLASSVAVALFPTISRLFIEENHDELRTTFDARVRAHHRRDVVRRRHDNRVGARPRQSGFSERTLWRQRRQRHGAGIAMLRLVFARAGRAAIVGARIFRHRPRARTGRHRLVCDGIILVLATARRACIWVAAPVWPSQRRFRRACYQRCCGARCPNI